MKWLKNLKSRTLRGTQKATSRRGPHDTFLTKDMALGFVDMVMSTREDEISCDECGERLSEFAELTLAGKNAKDAIPLVQDHLDRCAECREEFEALLDVLRHSD